MEDSQEPQQQVHIDYTYQVSFAWGVLISGSASAVASTWMLCQLCSLYRGGRRKQRLMGLQLLQLAAADIVFAFGFIISGVGYLVAMVSSDFPGDFGNVYCEACCYLQYVALMVSLSTNAHIALALASATARAVFALRILRLTVPLLLPLGLAAGTILAILERWHWERERHVCRAHTYYAMPVATVLCLVICITAYVYSAVKVHRSSQVVKERLWDRASLFVVAAIVTYVPEMLRYCFRDKNLSKIFIVVAVSLCGLNGFMNTCIYRWQSMRIVKQLNKNLNAREVSRESFRVDFNDVPSFKESTSEVPSESSGSDFRASLEFDGTRPNDASFGGTGSQEQAAAARAEFFNYFDSQFLSCFEAGHLDDRLVPCAATSDPHGPRSAGHLQDKSWESEASNAHLQ